MPSSYPSGAGSRVLGRVLIVDDERLVAEALQRALSPDADVTVVTAASDALALLWAGKRYDVVLCALMMPRMDGIELHRQLSGFLPREADRVVFFSGDALTARVESFFRRVPNVLLAEPIDIDGLRSLIERRTRERRRSDRPSRPSLNAQSPSSTPRGLI